MSLASIGAVRARPSLTPQKPLQHAYQRDPDAMAPWQRETYPAISGQAKWDEGEIYFLDESGVRVNAVYGTTWGQETAAGRIGARPASEHQRHVGRRAVRAKVSELGSRRTCALLLRLQMAVDGSLARLVKTFASTRKHLPERALHSAVWY